MLKILYKIPWNPVYKVFIKCIYTWDSSPWYLMVNVQLHQRKKQTWNPFDPKHSGLMQLNPKWNHLSFGPHWQALLDAACTGMVMRTERNLWDATGWEVQMWTQRKDTQRERERETLFSCARRGAISKLREQSPHMKNTMESILPSQVNRWALWSIPHPRWLLGDPARSQLPSASIILWCSTGRYLKFLRTRNMKCGPARIFFFKKTQAVGFLPTALPSAPGMVPICPTPIVAAGF